MAEPEQPRERALAFSAMLGLAFAVGVVGALGAIAFKATMAFFHDLFFYGELAFTYDPTVHSAPSPWGIAIVVVPVLGSLVVTWIRQTVAPQARGQGVAEVLDAIYYERGHLSPLVAIAKAVAAAVSIATGGSVGREGPIIQLAAAFGSTLARLARLPTPQCIVLIGAGGAAGIAAPFNAPIAGMVFAIELLLVSVSAGSIVLVGVAAVTATYVGGLYSGLNPTFNVPSLPVFDQPMNGLYTLLVCVPLGLLLGAAGSLFIHTVHSLEFWSRRRLPNPYLRHAAGMFVVGAMIYLFLWRTGHYYVAGLGYATIMDVLHGLLSDPWFLLLLFVAKLLATGLTLGSGASGGVFSPALFLGATLGCAVGNVVDWLVPAIHADPAVFAVAGMAAMVAASTGAVLTGSTMIFEQTRDYTTVLPIIACATLAYASRSYFTAQSMYTLGLSRRGLRIPAGDDFAMAQLDTAKRVMSTDFQLLDVGDLRHWEAGHEPGSQPRYTVVTRHGEVLGMMRDEPIHLLRDQDPQRIVDDSFFAVSADTRLPAVARGMRAKDTDKALVFRQRYTRRADAVAGVITFREIVRELSSGEEAQS